jgi:phosphotransferase system IIB component
MNIYLLIIDMLGDDKVELNLDLMNIILIVVGVLVVVGLTVFFLKRNKQPKMDSSLLINLLGGSKNIKTFDVRQSRVTFEVVDASVVDTEGIKALGAKGVVEVENSIKIIAGSNATKLYEEIQKLHK